MGIIERIRPPEVMHCKSLSHRQVMAFAWLDELSCKGVGVEDVGAGVVRATKTLVQWEVIESAGLIARGPNLELVYPPNVSFKKRAEASISGWDHGLVDQRDLNALRECMKEDERQTTAALGASIPATTVEDLKEHLLSMTIMDRLGWRTGGCEIVPSITFQRFQEAYRVAWKNALLPEKYSHAVWAFGVSVGWE